MIKTEWLNAESSEDRERAAALLKQGELVAVPTETVYGLAADATNPAAVRKIFQAKQRPSNHPLITHIASEQQLPCWAATTPSWIQPLAEKFWPGPLTLVLEKHHSVSDVITGGLADIGIRVPDHPVLLDILTRFNLALAAPSANPFQKLSPTTAEQVMHGMNGKIAAILDGGPCVVGTESTILRVHQGKAEILRSGPITAEELGKYLPYDIEIPQQHSVSVPGNQRIHYQPSANLFISDRNEIAKLLDGTRRNRGFLVISADLKNDDAENIVVMPRDARGYRSAMYSSLFRLDQQVADIWVEAPPRASDWLDIWDRLSRAATSI